MDLDSLQTILKMMVAIGPYASFLLVLRWWDGRKEDSRRREDAARYDALVDKWVASSERRSEANVAVLDAVKEKVNESINH